MTKTIRVIYLEVSTVYDDDCGHEIFTRELNAKLLEWGVSAEDVISIAPATGSIAPGRVKEFWIFVRSMEK